MSLAITVNQQTCYGETTTPKGRTRRTIPMTSTLEQALRGLRSSAKASSCGTSTAREVRWPGEHGDPPDLPPGRAAGKRWHTLRHTFGTHAALFGVNPWRLQSWMGHKRIDETMLYVHVAENHRREIPESDPGSGLTEMDPDRRILRMLGCAWQPRGSELGLRKRKGPPKQPL